MHIVAYLELIKAAHVGKYRLCYLLNGVLKTRDSMHNGVVSLVA